MIPEVIHQVWIGENPVPRQDVEFAETISHKKIMWAENPDVIEGPWDEVRPLPALNMEYALEVLRDRCTPSFLPAAISDIVRVEILAQEGGCYLDTDVFQVRPLFPFLSNHTLCISQEFSNRMIGNFMLASTPHHPALYRYMTMVHNKIADYIPGRSDFNPVGITGPLVTSAAFLASCDCSLLPFPMFSPWSQDHQFPGNWKDVPWPEATLAVHAFSSKWVNVRKSKSTLRDGMSATWRRGSGKIGGCG